MKTSIATLTAIFALASCASVTAPSEQASSTASQSAAATPIAMLVTMTESGCSSAPSSIGDVNAGQNSWKLRNQSASLASFQLVRIEDGSFDKLNALFLGTLEGPEPSPGAGGLPFVEEELSRVVVEPGTEGSLTDELDSGQFGILCIVLDENETIVTVYLTGPFSVVDGA